MADSSSAMVSTWVRAWSASRSPILAKTMVSVPCRPSRAAKATQFIGETGGRPLPHCAPAMMTAVASSPGRTARAGSSRPVSKYPRIAYTEKNGLHQVSAKAIRVRAT